MGNVGLLHIGHGNYVMISEIIAVADGRQGPTNHQIANARSSDQLIDLTNGNHPRSTIFTRQQLILSSVRAETLVSRINHQLLLHEAVIRAP